MSDQDQKKEPTISPQPDAESEKKRSTELSEEELKKVSGGRKAGGGPIDY
jgi:bacteriocin-like protein